LRCGHDQLGIYTSTERFGFLTASFSWYRSCGVVPLFLYFTNVWYQERAWTDGDIGFYSSSFLHSATAIRDLGRDRWMCLQGRIPKAVNHCTRGDEMNVKDFLFFHRFLHHFRFFPYVYSCRSGFVLWRFFIGWSWSKRPAFLAMFTATERNRLQIS